MKRFMDVIALIVIGLLFLVFLAFMLVGSLFVPIEPSQELSQLATAGIMRGAV